MKEREMPPDELFATVAENAFRPRVGRDDPAAAVQQHRSDGGETAKQCVEVLLRFTQPTDERASLIRQQ
jgi:hypothetical protein